MLEDEKFLWAMLFEAAHAGEEGMVSPEELKAVPELACYVEGWGREGDFGVVGGVGGVVQGAAWVRRFSHGRPAYGYVDDETPELAIGVMPGMRGAGVGTALLGELLDRARMRVPGVSLSVRITNPALRLYERMGFVEVPGTEVVDRSGGNSVTMVLRFS
ncbi:GNAT family N-acetyltransferase [Nocardia crassostreae]|uniref:GNAT family N-acetyltransferase n=1 Tax=Nocardia crassostreae TaxID=53428 RepID=UPI000AA38A89|nr:GNAT family N-acetyltransferase [Nocardia crassostreae]